MCCAELEEEGLSASAVEKLSKLKVFQHLRERHKTQQNKVQILIYAVLYLNSCMVSYRISCCYLSLPVVVMQPGIASK